MTAADPPATSSTNTHGPASFVAAVAALNAIDDALRDAQRDTPDRPDGPGPGPGPGPEQVLASLTLLRQVRELLAGWETGLIEIARDAGASWADLAQPLGVASRQAAERRYLRGRPGPSGTTGEQRVTATRQARAAERTTAAWARANAADLRRIAGQITALTDLPAAARRPLDKLHAALAHDDPADLIVPLAATRPYLPTTHPDLATRLDTLTPP
ncbi:type III effector protein [Streptomyces stelliscabiei]|uniref:type III effector protein n=1 Tax=Streptomyces stelliscabiei TaxID=146820 RepID=UPI0029B3CEF7|nr:type III effector protein [Streptomyces stelliscabiei]MDX2550685.1 type III effector protein [Streptomyces stelliscabiei]MDX2610383.1 type III effector protein [Streptomyces stelliscabiei]MDX2634696.1 type III effector protein [Streptomyces stelliscabiei]MDX2659642.1 type III effector protein [Streptomyces stelliscabiei]MDX2715287.1 type III effector protein [Streptomyces stelliscabiei]